jgi:hypothetical protein
MTVRLHRLPYTMSANLEVDNLKVGYLLPYMYLFAALTPDLNRHELNEQ